MFLKILITVSITFYYIVFCIILNHLRSYFMWKYIAVALLLLNVMRINTAKSNNLGIHIKHNKLFAHICHWAFAMIK